MRARAVDVNDVLHPQAASKVSILSEQQRTKGLRFDRDFIGWIFERDVAFEIPTIALRDDAATVALDLDREDHAFADDDRIVFVKIAAPIGQSNVRDDRERLSSVFEFGAQRFERPTLGIVDRWRGFDDFVDHAARIRGTPE